MSPSAAFIAALSNVPPGVLALPEARFTPLIPAFKAAAAAEGVEPEVLAAIAWAESDFVVTAVNPTSRATGLMQLMPFNFRPYGIEANPTEPVGNIRAGAKDLKAKGYGRRRFRDVMQGYNGLIIGNDTPEVDAKQLAGFNIYYSRIIARWAFFTFGGQFR